MQIAASLYASIPDFAYGEVNSNDGETATVAGQTSFHIRVYYGKTLNNPKITIGYHNMNINAVGFLYYPVIANITNTYFDMYTQHKVSDIRFMWFAISE